MPEPLLEVRDLHAWYGESHILHGVGFEIRPGETVTLLGRNGAGKTTTLKSIMGIVARRRGSVRLGGRELIDLPSNRIARLGLAFCPEERGIFASLTVEENLRLPPVVQPGGLGVDAIYELFPNLRERLRAGGTTLSGGEQQMLAIGRISGLAPDSSCWTSRPKAWRRSSSSRSAPRSAGSSARGSPSCSSSRTFASPRPWPTATM
jgi:branched-chain amino acid transport system ATP-binding protein